MDLNDDDETEPVSEMRRARAADKQARPVRVATGAVGAASAVVAESSDGEVAEGADEAVEGDDEVADVACMACKRLDDDEHILLCDGNGCPNAYHTYCMEPPLTRSALAKAACSCRILGRTLSPHAKAAC